jgi:hypothetical protein
MGGGRQKYAEYYEFKVVYYVAVVKTSRDDAASGHKGYL